MLRAEQEKKSRGWTNERLSLEAGIRSQHISEIFKGGTKIWPGWKQRIAKALEWPDERIDELFEEVQDD